MSKFPENTQYRVSANFSDRLKLIMDECDSSSNQQFAALVGVSVPVISKAVNFGIIPTTKTLVKIADKLEMSLLFLLGIADHNEFFAATSRAVFRDRLEELTKEKNLNYGQLASKLDFPRTYIYEWMKENYLPSVDYVLEIAEFFNVTPDYLLGRSDDKS